MGFYIMNKPNFSTMTRKELREYALIHREDDDVFTELIDRAMAERKGKLRPAPQTDEDFEQMQEIFRRKIAGEEID
jgi:hypothetical protein